MVKMATTTWPNYRLQTVVHNQMDDVPVALRFSSVHFLQFILSLLTQVDQQSSTTGDCTHPNGLLISRR